MLVMVTTNGRVTPTTMKCAPLARRRIPTGYRRRNVMRTPALPIATNEGTSGRLWRSSSFMSRMNISSDTEMPVSSAATIPSVRHGRSAAGRT